CSLNTGRIRPIHHNLFPFLVMNEGFLFESDLSLNEIVCNQSKYLESFFNLIKSMSKSTNTAEDKIIDIQYSSFLSLYS
ncbi:MAG: hypothetical protein PHR06_10095, partial [Candidatus Cloacimonetes bacterium]|nr:hypothetical protein [Candidatus Cloacimonadota bacterium]